MFLSIVVHAYLIALFGLLFCRALYNKHQHKYAWAQKLEFATWNGPYMIVSFGTFGTAAILIFSAIMSTHFRESDAVAKCAEKGGTSVSMNGKQVCLDPSVIIKLD